MASSRLMPMPLSAIVMVRACVVRSMVMTSSPPPCSSSGCASASNRSLSSASEALEISSRRKISLWLYSEWIISLSSCLTSAWKPRVCVPGSSSGSVVSPQSLISNPPRGVRSGDLSSGAVLWPSAERRIQEAANRDGRFKRVMPGCRGLGQPDVRSKMTDDAGATGRCIRAGASSGGAARRRRTSNSVAERITAEHSERDVRCEHQREAGGGEQSRALTKAQDARGVVTQHCQSRRPARRPTATEIPCTHSSLSPRRLYAQHSRQDVRRLTASATANSEHRTLTAAPDCLHLRPKGRRAFS